jgi:hypothetical protein
MGRARATRRHERIVNRPMSGSSTISPDIDGGQGFEAARTERKSLAYLRLASVGDDQAVYIDKLRLMGGAGQRGLRGSSSGVKT